jgi:threonine/homoserine/homoserine lactone efflux protein
MFGITDLYLFIIAVLLLNITPGADMLYILSNTVQKGFKAGVVATLGTCIGCLFHVFLAVVGLSALLQSSETAFMIVKYIGAIYLVYLGTSMIFSKNKKMNIEKSVNKSKSLKKIFNSGVLINIFNPKIAIFFITFLPQFVGVNSKNISMALLVLGLVFILFGFLTNVIIAYISVNITSKFSFTNTISNIIKKIAGTLFIGFGIKLAMEK